MQFPIGAGAADDVRRRVHRVEISDFGQRHAAFACRRRSLAPHQVRLIEADGMPAAAGDDVASPAKTRSAIESGVEMSARESLRSGNRFASSWFTEAGVERLMVRGADGPEAGSD